MIIDITPVISSQTAVFPGDQQFARHVQMSFQRGHHLELSSIQSTLHIGAHADSPLHYHPAGLPIEQRSLQPYMGLCQVITVTQVSSENGRILWKDIQVPIEAPRILFRTLSFPNPECWQDSFFSLSPELIQNLVNKNVVLVGIDTPSIDPSDSKDLPSHQAVYRSDLSVLEGLLLEHVQDGLYDLIALPLPLKGADASPVRAVLLPPHTLQVRD